MNSDEKALALIKLLGEEIMVIRQDMLDIFQNQEDLVKFMAARMPMFTPQERADFQAVAAKVETALEHDEAALSALRVEFERLYNA